MYHLFLLYAIQKKYLKSKKIQARLIDTKLSEVSKTTLPFFSILSLTIPIVNNQY